MDMKRTRFLALLATSQIALCVALPAGAAAQEEEASAPTGDVIVVTARKKEETLQDVPLSVDAFDSEGLKERGLKDISEVSNFTPGFTMEKFGGRRGAEGDTSRPVIRGQSNILGETNAAVFVDGILYSGSFLSFPFAAVERVEVVKGPQAALFGRATFAGAVNVITKKGTNEFENNVTATVADFGEYDINVSSSGPLIEDKLFYFVHGRYYDYGGEYKNSLDGQKVGEEQTIGFNGSLEFHPSDTVSMTLRAGYNEDDDGPAAQVVQSRFFNNCFLDQARQYYCGEVQEFDETTLDLARLGDDAGLTREVLRISGSMEWDIGGSGYILSSNAGYTDSSSVYGQDNTFLGNLNNFAGNTLVRVEHIDQDEWSAELRLDTPASESIRGTFGTFYYEREKDSFRRFPMSTAVIADFGTQYTDNWAIFGAVEADLSPALTARAEIRYSEDTIGVETAAGPVLEETFSSVTPRFTLDYQATDDMLLYGVIALGNKPGYINEDPALPADLIYVDEEEAWNYEIGAKTSWADNTFFLNVAAYFIDWDKQQLSNSVFVGGVPTSIVTNAGKTEVKGFEIDSQWIPTDELKFDVGYAYSDAELTDFCDPVQGGELTGFDCVNDDGVQGGQTAGNQIPNSPKHHFTASSQYTKPIMDGQYDWFLRGDYAYISKKYAQVHNLAHTGDRSLLNLRTGFAKGDAWKLTFFVDNVLDDKTPSTVVRYADLVNGNFAPQPPEQNNVPGTTPYERGFLFPLVESRQFGATFSINF
ncbi:TonB-dependent receptor [Parvularcula marina]|uniref:TonB-dependent receptor n=2 Tax=Parvularcula marina TaxID=2292771 RepID=UPI003517300C